MLTGSHHISMICSSERSISFYEKLGFEVERRIERTHDTVVLMSGLIDLEIYIDPSHPKQGKLLPLGLRNISLVTENIEAIANEFKENIETDWYGEKYIMLKDPDGNIVQLHE